MSRIAVSAIESYSVYSAGAIDSASGNPDLAGASDMMEPGKWT
jgi:hypothetical protein